MAISLATGLVTSWANHTSLIAGSASSPSSFELMVSQDEGDSTVFASTVYARSFAVGLYNATARITSQLNSPKFGTDGLVTTTGSGYVTNCYAWNATIDWEPQPADKFASTGPSMRSFIPGLLRMTGSYSCWVDTSTAITKASTPGTAETLTFKFIEDGANDKTITASCWIRPRAVVQVGDIPSVTYDFASTGNVTIGGYSAGVKHPLESLHSSGTIITPTIGSLVMQSHASRTYTMDAFVSSWSIDVNLNGLVVMNLTAQGTYSNGNVLTIG